ncbi:hypothetical protein C265_19199 [Cupriavidus sp. GA3-3]|nr:hypothetical protein C265_19199 [Cupriavidus sp. GA3-3]
MAAASSIRPAFRSASIDICLPGIESSMKRAPTSAIRPAPLVITMKLITTRIANTTMPTAKLPPTRKWPKASTTLPAASGPVWPSSSTTRVDATFSDRRSSVVNSSTAGKAAKSSGFCVYMLTSSTMIASAILKVNSRSSTKAGSGRIIIPRIMMISSGPVMALSWPAERRPGRFNRLLRAFIGAFPVRRVHRAPAGPRVPAAAGPASNASASVDRPRPALRPRRYTVRRGFPGPAPRGGAAHAPAAGPTSAARGALQPARGCGRQYRRCPWPPRAARPCALPHSAAPRQSGWGWSPPRRPWAPRSSCGGAPWRAAAGGCGP